MRLGVSENGSDINRRQDVPTPQNYEEAMKEFKKAASSLIGGMDVKKAIGGLAAMLDEGATSIFGSPNLLGWVGKHIRNDMQTMLGIPVVIENDAAIAGLGEAMYGAGRGINNFVYITVSTGVGGCRIVDQKIDRKVYSLEPGQQILNLEKETTLENLVSGKAIEKRFGLKPYEIQQDNFVWTEFADILAVGLYNSVIHWSPEAIILGGSMILGRPCISVDKIESKLRQLITFYPTAPIIKKALLGDESGLHGALSLSKSF